MDTTITQLPPELTAEEIKAYEDQSKDLARKYEVSKVHPVVSIDKETLARIVCFLKEPNYITKIRIMDKAVTLGIYSAADELREIITLRSESDPITYGEGSECDKYKMGVTDYCLMMIERTKNQFKKK